MKKNGFTLVELITSFALVMSISVLLLGIIVNLKGMFENSGIKTQLLNKQALMSQKINQTLHQKGLSSLQKCGQYCVIFQYKDGTSDQLLLENHTFTFGDYKMDLGDSYFQNPTIDVVTANRFGYYRDNAILTIEIPIYNDQLKDQNFGISIVYPFNTDTSTIESLSLTSRGYILLNGEKQKEISMNRTYQEDGYIAYDQDGNRITTPTVRITNPFLTMTTPYILGSHEIIKDCFSF